MNRFNFKINNNKRNREELLKDRSMLTISEAVFAFNFMIMSIANVSANELFTKK